MIYYRYKKFIEIFPGCLNRLFFAIVVFASFSAFSQKDLQVVRLQERVLDIYNELLASTVRVEVGSSGASAVLVSEDGYILTAAHVIDAVGGEEAEVRLHDGSVYIAKCFGKSDLGDYGLMKIEPKKPLLYARIGNASKLAKDDACLMFGHSSTSESKRPAIGRIGFYKGKTFDGFLKTTCIMMPGDSGGPLFNLNGELIGVCSYIGNGFEMNFYPSVENIKKNWEKLIAGEVFDQGESRFNMFTTEAREKEGEHVLNGGKRTLYGNFRNFAATLEKAVVRIESIVDGRMNETFGTLYSNQGHIVAKSSEVGSIDVDCILYNGHKFGAKVIGRDDPNDLVVLKVDSKQELFYIPLDSSAQVKAGNFVATVFPEPALTPMAGILGLGPRKISSRDTGFFGIGFDQTNELMLSNIDPGGPGALYGLENGDVITSFNENSIQSRSDFIKYLPHTRPNQKVSIGVLREDKNLVFEVVLGKRKEASTHARVIETNKVRDGFPKAFSHDIPIQPSQCGSPVINMDGKVIGINIARRNRTSTLAIPLSQVRTVISQMK